VTSGIVWVRPITIFAVLLAIVVSETTSNTASAAADALVAAFGEGSSR
jgi:hypothetical protein